MHAENLGAIEFQQCLTNFDLTNQILTHQGPPKHHDMRFRSFRFGGNLQPKLVFQLIGDFPKCKANAKVAAK